MDPNLFSPAPPQPVRLPVALGALFAGAGTGVGCLSGELATMPGGTRPDQESVILACTWLAALLMVSVFFVWATGGLRPPERGWARALFLFPALAAVPAMAFFLLLAGMSKGPA
jgi:hypothetical protein